jgi:hypothetical protein
MLLKNITKNVNFVKLLFYKYFKIKNYINLVISITIFCKRTPIYQLNLTNQKTYYEKN